MVETGVAHGVSSWTILNAMHRNGKGKLYSIDLPNKDLKSYNPENIAKLKQYLSELDRRRNTNWKLTFPWLDQDWN